jgi:hypothetical protein
MPVRKPVRTAAEVLDACEQAVTFAPDYGNYRDSRGLARALTENFTSAIEDFQVFVEWINVKWAIGEKAKAQRQQWITVLQKGENPFTPEVLEQLRQE